MAEDTAETVAEKATRLCTLARDYRYLQGIWSTIQEGLDELGVDYGSPQFEDFIDRVLQPDGRAYALKWLDPELGPSKPVGKMELVRRHLIENPKPQTASEIAVQVGLPVPNVSNVLSILRQSGQVENISEDHTWRWTGREGPRSQKFGRLEDNPKLLGTLVQILTEWPDSKISGAELAAKLGRSPSGVGSTLRALCRMGILRRPPSITHTGNQWVIVKARLQAVAESVK